MEQEMEEEMEQELFEEEDQFQEAEQFPEAEPLQEAEFGQINCAEPLQESKHIYSLFKRQRQSLSEFEQPREKPYCAVPLTAMSCWSTST